MSETLPELIESALKKHEDYQSALKEYWFDREYVDVQRRELAAALAAVLMKKLFR